MKQMLWVCLLAATACCTMPRPCEAQPFARILHYIAHHKELLASDAILVAAWSADSASTIHALRVCPACQETNRILGHRPSPAAVWSLGLGFASAHIAANHVLIHESRYRHTRLLLWTPVGLVASGAASRTWHNAKLAN